MPSSPTSSLSPLRSLSYSLSSSRFAVFSLVFFCFTFSLYFSSFSRPSLLAEATQHGGPSSLTESAPMSSDPFLSLIGKRLVLSSESPPAALREGQDYLLEANLRPMIRAILAAQSGGQADDQATGGIRILDENTVVTMEYRKDRWNVLTRQSVIQSITRG